MLRYHVAFFLPPAPGQMVVVEALDFPRAVTQGFDLADARLMIASALEDLAAALLEESKPLPIPSEGVSSWCRYRFTPEALRDETARIAGPPPTARMHSFPGRWSSFDLSNPATGAKAPVPRHAEIDNRLARKICDQLGIASIR